MNDGLKYVVYFFLGGLLVSVSTYLGSHGKGFLAALASTLPVISGLTFILVYLNAGGTPTVHFAKNLIWLSPPWFMYVGTMILAVPKFGFWIAFAMAITLYLIGVGCTRLLVE
jgi:hypothetical protein